MLNKKHNLKKGKNKDKAKGSEIRNKTEHQKIERIVGQTPYNVMF